MLYQIRHTDDDRSLHDSTPAMIAPMVSCLPVQAPSSFYAALDVVRALTHCTTAKNPSFPRFSALAAKFDVTISTGEIVSASLALSKSGIDTKNGLLEIPSETGTRAFDAMYYLVTSSSKQEEKETLDLKPLHSYHLLKRLNTFSPPSYIPTADDAAAAEDFRTNLRSIGIKGRILRDFICALAGLLKLGDACDYFVGEDEIDEICDAAASLLDLPKAQLDKQVQDKTTPVFIAGIYEALVDWVIEHANTAMQYELRTGNTIGSDNGASTPPSPMVDEDETVSIRVVSIPSQELGKAIAMRTVFDDSEGINAEMKEDGVDMAPVGSSITREMQAAVQSVEADLGIMTGASGHAREADLDKREGVLESVAQAISEEEDCFLSPVLHPVSGQGVLLGNHGRFDLAQAVSSSRVWFQLCLHPTDEMPAKLEDTSKQHWSAGAVSSQLRAWRLPEWANRRNRSLDYTADFAYDEFTDRYAPLGCQEGKEGVQAWIVERGWSNGEVVDGHERVWMREAAYMEAEQMLEIAVNNHNNPGSRAPSGMGVMAPMGGDYSVHSPQLGSSFFGTPAEDISQENLLSRNQSFAAANKSRLTVTSKSPTITGYGGGDYGLGSKGDTYKGEIRYDGGEDGKHIEVIRQTMGRKVWVVVVWALTFWIPSPALVWIGRMKRPDIRMAWREKLVLVFLILLLNGIIVFYIIEFGRLLCPNFDKAWNAKEVSTHQGDQDFYVSHAGKVYDLSKFWRIQHSDSNIKVTPDLMQPFAGTDVTGAIRPPLTLACSGLVDDPLLKLDPNNTLVNPLADHTSGPELNTNIRSALNKADWYSKVFLPAMNEYYKGALVWKTSVISSEGRNDNHMWFRMGESVYDLTDYYHNKDTVHLQDDRYAFFPSDFTDIVEANAGQDITSIYNEKLNATTRNRVDQCLNNYFYIGKTDFRDSPRCQVNGYILLAFTIILCTVIVIKFLSALQLGSKRRPSPQDKFVICQVPAYTEGEEQLRKGLDSLTSLNYDNKRKLICVVCDGMIVGGGNDRPTPKIVLDILGVDPKIDPPALPFKSVGAGSEQLNYGKVYSGLYEYEGNVVPYIVIVKVGKESEQQHSKPGNRGKRDSQILLMSFLNRVHHRSPMSPLELEVYHQISNVIGVDPELYEYLMMVDADTMVMEDSLNRLVAACANDSKIAGICGETSLDNEDRSWWTMIQVYEYYISHHLAKAFESLFGSVTCLPGW